MGTMPRMSRMRVFLWCFIAGLLMALGYYELKLAPPPVSGGGNPDSWAASRLKSQIYATVSPEEEAGFQRLTAANAPGWYQLNAEPIQGFDFYRTQNPPRPANGRKTIVLQPMGPFPKQAQAMLEPLRDYCARFFQLPVRVARPIPLPKNPQGLRPKRNKAPQWCSGEGQYLAPALLDDVLLPRVPADAFLYLGITMADIYSPDLNFVFGLGSLRDRVGVYSLTRNFPEFSGGRSSAADRTRALDRSCKILSHEAGHMLGMYHCVLYTCGMNGSNGLADTDRIPREFCPICRRKLLWNVGADGKKRARELAEFEGQHLGNP